MKVHTIHRVYPRAAMASIRTASMGAYSVAFPCARTTLCSMSAGSDPWPMFVLVEPRSTDTAKPRPKTSNPRSAEQTSATFIAGLLSCLRGVAEPEGAVHGPASAQPGVRGEALEQHGERHGGHERGGAGSLELLLAHATYRSRPREAGPVRPSGAVLDSRRVRAQQPDAQHPGPEHLDGPHERPMHDESVVRRASNRSSSRVTVLRGVDIERPLGRVQSGTLSI